MSQEILLQAKTLIQNQKIEEARALLESMPGDPTAQRWLDKLNKRFPASGDDARLQQARELLRSKRFREARTLLMEMQHHPIARQWLADLDKIEKGRSKPKPAPSSSTAQTSGVAQRVGDLVRSSGFRMMMGTLMMFLAVAMIVAFVFAPWVDTEVMGFSLSEGSNSTCSAGGIWIGRDICQAMGLVDVDTFARGNTGFSAVRMVDRLLILILVVAVGIAYVGWRFATDSMERMPSLWILAALSLFILLFPFLWEYLSDEYGQTNDEFSIVSMFLPQYKTNLMKMLGAGSLILSVVLIVLYAMDNLGQLGQPREAPSMALKGFNPAAEQETYSTVFAERKKTRRH